VVGRVVTWDDILELAGVIHVQIANVQAPCSGLSHSVVDNLLTGFENGLVSSRVRPHDGDVQQEQRAVVDSYAERVAALLGHVREYVGSDDLQHAAWNDAEHIHERRKVLLEFVNDEGHQCRVGLVCPGPVCLSQPPGFEALNSKVILGRALMAVVSSSEGGFRNVSKMAGFSTGRAYSRSATASHSLSA